MEYLTVKWLHIMASTFLFGTGVGSAFYLLFASLSRDARAVAVVAHYVVIADWLFTATTIVIQPLTGFYLVHLAKIPLTTEWILWSIGLYLGATLCWLPVVWLQMRMRDMAHAAASQGRELPPEYWRYLRVWVTLGIPAFMFFVLVFWLMVVKRF